MKCILCVCRGGSVSVSCKTTAFTHFGTCLNGFYALQNFFFFLTLV